MKKIVVTFLSLRFYQKDEWTCEEIEDVIKTLYHFDTDKEYYTPLWTSKVDINKLLHKYDIILHLIYPEDYKNMNYRQILEDYNSRVF